MTNQIITINNKHYNSNSHNNNNNNNSNINHNYICKYNNNKQ